jgi:hypothetical protein
MDEQYLRDLYTQVLGREPDPEGFAHNLALLQSGAVNIGDLTNAFVTSPEAQQNTIPAAQEQKAAQGLLGGQGINTEERAKELADQVYGAYSSNVNYDAELNELNSLAAIDPEAFYKARINLLGKQMGWQVGQNTSGENVRYEAELNSLLAGAQQAGLSNEEVNTLVTSGANQANRENQERIARDAAKGQGWVNQNIPGGYATLGALAAAIAAPYALGAFGAGSAGAAGAGAGAAGAGGSIGGISLGGAFAPTVGSGASFLVPGAVAAGAGAAGAAGSLEAYMAAAGLNPGTFAGSGFALPSSLGVGSFVTPELMGPTYGELGYTGLAEGLMGPTYQELGYTGLNLGEASAAADAAAAGLSAKSLLSGAGSLLNSPLGRLGAMGGLSMLSGGGEQQQPVPQMAGGGGTYAPRGQVDYRPIIDLLAPRQISRTSLLG